MNRHFRVPPEHQEFWQETKSAIKPFLIALAFGLAMVIGSIWAVIHYT